MESATGRIPGNNSGVHMRSYGGACLGPDPRGQKQFATAGGRGDIDAVNVRTDGGIQPGARLSACRRPVRRSWGRFLGRLSSLSLLAVAIGGKGSPRRPGGTALGSKGNVAAAAQQLRVEPGGSVLALQVVGAPAPRVAGQTDERPNAYRSGPAGSQPHFCRYGSSPANRRQALPLCRGAFAGRPAPQQAALHP